jgi:hypothetical protein
MTDDRHSPTTAAPSPTPATQAAPPPVGPPPLTTVVASPPDTAAEQQSELPFGIPPDRPEILVGAAFAGGLVAAFILRRFGGD